MGGGGTNNNTHTIRGLDLAIFTKSQDSRACSVSKERDAGRGTRGFTSWPLGAAAPSSHSSGSVKPLLRNTEWWLNTKGSKDATPSGKEVGARVSAPSVSSSLV